MKKVILLLALSFALTTVAQEKKKQYKSAETGRYVSKSTAQKSPSTTYSTPRKSSSSSTSTSTRSTSSSKRSRR
jgi:hypothetical protein